MAKYRKKRSAKLIKLEQQKIALKHNLHDVDVKLWWLKIDFLWFTFLFFFIASILIVANFLNYYVVSWNLIYTLVGFGFILMLIDYFKHR